MTENEHLVPLERIEQSIHLIRGKKVMLDVDLAILYGESTKRLNEQFKRNTGRFPGDFAFQLTDAEKIEVVAKCDHLKGKLKFSPYLPYAFTEHGALMLANVIKSPIAIQASIQIVRAFVRLREFIENQEELARKITDLEAKYTDHDDKINRVFAAIRQLMTPVESAKPPIGFK